MHVKSNCFKLRIRWTPYAKVLWFNDSVNINMQFITRPVLFNAQSVACLLSKPSQVVGSIATPGNSVVDFLADTNRIDGFLGECRLQDCYTNAILI